MPRSLSRLQLAFVFGGLSLAIIAIYWPGLSGGFLLDDFENFAPLGRFLGGDLSWSGVVFGNASGPLGRPISMLSFLGDAWLFGLEPVPFLRTNLMLHLLCGALIAVLVGRVLRRDPQFSGSRGLLVAGAVTLIWALLPLHVSVVLYAVQRMALLSTLFVLAALLAYVVGRERLARNRKGWGSLLFVAFPVLTACAALSKENGALAPLLAAAIELAWFRDASSSAERRWRTRFFALFLLLPLLIVIGLLIAKPAAFLGAYETRTFTLGERLLTQPRVLWDYIRHIVVPFGPAMGLIHDDYSKSTGLLQPWTTLLAIIAWAVAALLAWRARHVAPALIGGLGLFLAAHAMESTILPLELYFEHRNYLASVGVLLVCASLIALIGARLATPSPAFRKALGAAAVALPVAFASATFARASVWSNPQARMQQALETSPTSPRLRSQLAIAVAEQGDLPAALAHIAMAASGPAAPPARTIALWQVLAACLANGSLAGADPTAGLVEATSPRIALTEMVSFEALAKRIEAGQCQWPTAAQAITIGHAMLAQTRQAPTAHEVWRVRYNLARLVASTGDFDTAVELAQRAWNDSQWNTGVGVLVFQLNASRGDFAACRRTLDRLAAMDLSRDVAMQKAVAQLEAFLAAEAESNGGGAVPLDAGSVQ